MDRLQIHVRLKQYKTRSYVTSIEGLPSTTNLNNILKTMKKLLGCNGTIKNTMIQLSGDHRENVKQLLIKYDVCNEDEIIIHGI